VQVLLEAKTDAFSISVSDSGGGPDAAQSHARLGTRIVETLASQINAVVVKERMALGYRVTVTVPTGGSTL
jgi:two-component sensor histidine kinase